MLRSIIAFIAGTVTYLLFGWVVFEKFIGEFTEANTTTLAGFRKDASPSGFGLLLLSCGAYTALMVLILGHWKKARTPMEGFKVGMVVGTLVAIMTDSYWYATSHFYNNPKPVVLDILAAAMTVGVMGWVIAGIFTYKGKE